MDAGTKGKRRHRLTGEWNAQDMGFTDFRGWGRLPRQGPATVFRAGSGRPTAQPAFGFPVHPADPRLSHVQFSIPIFPATHYILLFFMFFMSRTHKKHKKQHYLIGYFFARRQMTQPVFWFRILPADPRSIIYTGLPRRRGYQRCCPRQQRGLIRPIARVAR